MNVFHEKYLLNIQMNKNKKENKMKAKKIFLSMLCSTPILCSSFLIVSCNKKTQYSKNDFNVLRNAINNNQIKINFENDNNEDINISSLNDLNVSFTIKEDIFDENNNYFSNLKTILEKSKIVLYDYTIPSFDNDFDSKIILKINDFDEKVNVSLSSVFINNQSIMNYQNFKKLTNEQIKKIIEEELNKFPDFISNLNSYLSALIINYEQIFKTSITSAFSIDEFVNYLNSMINNINNEIKLYFINQYIFFENNNTYINSLNFAKDQDSENKINLNFKIWTSIDQNNENFGYEIRLSFWIKD